MNIDERIRKELQDEHREIDEILADEKSIFGMLGRAYRGGLGRWVIFGTVLGTALTVIIIWAGWQFFTTADTRELVFWGVIALAALHAQVAMKLWIFMEMNRASVVRETKRLELALARLEERLEDRSEQ